MHAKRLRSPFQHTALDLSAGQRVSVLSSHFHEVALPHVAPFVRHSLGACPMCGCARRLAR
jgi:hypothetical protein